MASIYSRGDGIVSKQPKYVRKPCRDHFIVVFLSLTFFLTGQNCADVRIEGGKAVREL
jgi:hypothetical protein